MQRPNIGQCVSGSVAGWCIAARVDRWAATAGLLVAQKHPQLGVTYRAGSFLMQAVAYGLGLSFGDAEALNADSIVSKVVDSMRVTR